MALTGRDQLTYLMAFTAASLFLLIEMHAFDERATWLRRRIGDPSTISLAVPARRHRVHRGGDGGLAAADARGRRPRPSPAPGTGIDDQLIRIGEELGRLFPVGGDFRGGGGVSFGSTARISDRWFSDDKIAFTATVPPRDRGRAAGARRPTTPSGSGRGSRRTRHGVPVRRRRAAARGHARGSRPGRSPPTPGSRSAPRTTTTRCCWRPGPPRPSTGRRTCSCSATTAGSRAWTCRAAATSTRSPPRCCARWRRRA